MDQEYRGPDRRSVPRPPRGSARAALVGAGAGSCAAVVLEAATRADAPAALAAVVGAAPLVLATVLLLCAWRVGGRVRQAHAALTLAVAGGSGPLVAWAAAQAAPGAAAPVVALTLAAGVLAAAPHAHRALTAPDVDTRLRPGAAALSSSGLVLAAGGGAALLAGAGWLPQAHPPGALAHLPWPLLWPAPLGAAGGAALSLAVERWRASLQGQRVRALRAVRAAHGLGRWATDAEEDRVRRHDARSALSAVRAASAVLTGEQPSAMSPTEHSALATAVSEELSRLERLLGEPAGGTADLGPAGGWPEVVDLRDVVAPLVTTWRARGLDVSGPPPGPAVLAVGHPDALRRAVANLLDNALRHAPGAAVAVSAAAAHDGGPALLVVHDDGPGVSAAHREAVFTAGTRLSPSAPGQGLGLASARALVEADGGSLRLAEADRGARFELRLPSARRPVPSCAAVPAPAPTPDLEEVTAR
ncbi:sensor histidine kinase [Quadrisphaera sp. KR29]|uniref:sensor histidine kinase n=1 Tax=Quadrisphaera sp. KR29 TaxID=3461391 RepID=UPI004044C1F2